MPPDNEMDAGVGVYEYSPAIWGVLSDQYSLVTNLDLIYSLVVKPLMQIWQRVQDDDVHPYIGRERFEMLLEQGQEWPCYWGNLTWERLNHEGSTDFMIDDYIHTELEWEIWCDDEELLRELAISYQMVDPYEFCAMVRHHFRFLAVASHDICGVFVLSSTQLERCGDMRSMVYTTVGNPFRRGDLLCAVIPDEVMKDIVEALETPGDIRELDFQSTWGEPEGDQPGVVWR